MAGARDFLAKLAFLIGFRRSYRLEIASATAAFLFFIVSILSGLPMYIYLPVIYTLLLFPLGIRILYYKHGIYKSLYMPLYPIILSAVMSAMNIYILPATLVLIVFMEDVVEYANIPQELFVQYIKRGAHIITEPLKKIELLVLIAINTVPAVIVALVTGQYVVLVSPAISYFLILYSIVMFPEARMEIKRKISFLELLSIRFKLLTYLFVKIYQSKSMQTKAKEAGFIGISYDIFIRKTAGLFILAIYLGLILATILQPIIGGVAFILPVLLGAIVFFIPGVYVDILRSSRSSKIDRNLLLILTYIAALKSVGESFTDMMRRLKRNPGLARMFGLEKEAEIYLALYSARNSESEAISMYADTVPHDYYRDTIRTAQGIEENEGSYAVFRMCVDRLKEYTGRYISRIDNYFKNIGSNIISVVLLAESVLPILLFLSNPRITPLMIFGVGMLSAVLVYIISAATMPDLPMEFTHAKPRYKAASVYATITSILLTALDYYLMGGDSQGFPVLAAINMFVGIMVAVWYANKKDLEINNGFLSKFSDILPMFSNTVSRAASIDQSLEELSHMHMFPKIVREEFRKLASTYKFLGEEHITYKGPFWYKYFTFLTTIATKMGAAPRELYNAIKDFMLEFKRFIYDVRGFGVSLLFMFVVGLAIMNFEVYTITTFASALQKISELQKQVSGAAGGIAASASNLPSLSPGDVAFINTWSTVALFFTAAMNGLALAKVVSGTVRDGKWVLLSYIVQLVIYAVLKFMNPLSFMASFIK